GLLSVHSRCGLHSRTVTVYRDRYPKASDTSSPPCLLRSLPAGAVAGWGLHPLEKRRLVTAHVESGHPVRCKDQQKCIRIRPGGGGTASDRCSPPASERCVVVPSPSYSIEFDRMLSTASDP